MKLIRYILVLLSGFLFFVNSTSAQYMPKSGSAERKAIVGAFQATLERDFKERYVEENFTLRVSVLRVKNGWAVISATPLKQDGTKFSGCDFFTTEGDDCYRMSTKVSALLEKRRETWRVVEFDVGSFKNMGKECRKRKCPVELRR